MRDTNNLRINKLRPLISPNLLMDEIPLTQPASQLIESTRQQISQILHGEDNRLLVLVGPCSIHDPRAAIEYAEKLQPLAAKLAGKLCIIMRVYFEKPRSTIGWKGLINDPNLDNSYQINKGLHLARELLLEINNHGLPTGSEFLDTVIPQYISDLTSWAAIGARTTESQIHRELASGLSMPVGFKNGTTGNINIAVDAAYSAKHPHNFLGVTTQGIAGIVSTTGNPDSHIILRGSSHGPNYHQSTICNAISMLQEKKLPQKIMIDCSHGNSNKDYRKQKHVVDYICEQLKQNNKHIFGLMIESNLIDGNQALVSRDQLTYGQSITDSCIGWNETVDLLHQISDAVSHRTVNNLSIAGENK